jgi:PTS system nitrogen regulatory IIA component
MYYKEEYRTNHDRIMTLSEVAEYLKLAEKTVLRMAHRGDIPCAKVASQWRFLQSVIDDWLISKMRVVPKNDLSALIASGQSLVPLSRLVRENLVVPQIHPGTKEQVLRQLVRPLTQEKLVQREEVFIEQLLDRERIVSTGIGAGIAMPHLRNPQENPEGGPFIVVGICSEGTDFEALDGQKTYLFFLLCTNSVTVHLRVLARLTLITRDQKLRSALLQAKTRQNVFDVLIEADQFFNLTLSRKQ